MSFSPSYFPKAHACLPSVADSSVPLGTALEALIAALNATAVPPQTIGQYRDSFPPDEDFTKFLRHCLPDTKLARAVSAYRALTAKVSAAASKQGEKNPLSTGDPVFRVTAQFLADLFPTTEVLQECLSAVVQKVEDARGQRKLSRTDSGDSLTSAGSQPEITSPGYFSRTRFGSPPPPSAATPPVPASPPSRPSPSRRTTSGSEWAQLPLGSYSPLVQRPSLPPTTPPLPQDPFFSNPHSPLVRCPSPVSKTTSAARRGTGLERVVNTAIFLLRCYIESVKLRYSIVHTGNPDGLALPDELPTYLQLAQAVSKVDMCNRFGALFADRWARVGSGSDPLASPAESKAIDAVEPCRRLETICEAVVQIGAIESLFSRNRVEGMPAGPDREMLARIRAGALMDQKRIGSAE